MIFSYLQNMQSHPSWVCGLKPIILFNNPIRNTSHPSWVCGLKLKHTSNRFATLKSHPSWVCGLKLISIHSKFIGHFVTPFVGVWIETLQASR